MTDKSNKGGKTPGNPKQKRVVAKIPQGEFDTSLKQPLSDASPAIPQNPKSESPLGTPVSSGPPKSKIQNPKSGQPAYRAPFPFDTIDDKLDLPDGGLVAMRKSGGLRFTSNTVIVYHDGRVSFEPDSAFGAPSHPQTQKLSDRDLAELYRALDMANLPKLDPISGHQNPDTYAYEIVTRIGGTVYRVETFDGSIPQQLSPLIQVLAKYSKPAP